MDLESQTQYFIEKKEIFIIANSNDGQSIYNAKTEILKQF